MTDILQEAGELINGQRAQDYGDVTDNFTRIALLWSAYLDVGHLSPHDVSMMMILVKVARQSDGYHRDSVVDIAGYAALDEKVSDARRSREVEDEAGYAALAEELNKTFLSPEFWDDIDQSIVEAQEKRERDRTSKPPGSERSE